VRVSGPGIGSGHLGAGGVGGVGVAGSHVDLRQARAARGEEFELADLCDLLSQPCAEPSVDFDLSQLPDDFQAELAAAAADAEQRAAEVATASQSSARRLPTESLPGEAQRGPFWAAPGVSPCARSPPSMSTTAAASSPLSPSWSFAASATTPPSVGGVARGPSAPFGGALRCIGEVGATPRRRADAFEASLGAAPCFSAGGGGAPAVAVADASGRAPHVGAAPQSLAPPSLAIELDPDDTALLFQAMQEVEGALMREREERLSQQTASQQHPHHFRAGARSQCTSQNAAISFSSP